MDLSSIQLRSINLKKVEFDAMFDIKTLPKDGAIGFNVHLNFAVSDDDQVKMALGWQTDEYEHFSANIVYQAIFKHGPCKTVEERAEYLRHIVGDVGPHIIFPFIRQTLMNCTLHAGLANFIMPLTDIREMIKESKIDFVSAATSIPEKSDVQDASSSKSRRKPAKKKS